jgi:hypothetical protein
MRRYIEVSDYDDALSSYIYCSRSWKPLIIVMSMFHTPYRDVYVLRIASTRLYRLCYTRPSPNDSFGWIYLSLKEACVSTYSAIAKGLFGTQYTAFYTERTAGLLFVLPCTTCTPWY